MNFSQESLMHGGYISEEVCDLLLDTFHKSKKWAKPGVVITDEGIGVDKNIKDSIEVSLNPYATASPVPDYREAMKGFVDEYIQKYKILSYSEPFNILHNFNIQYYPPGGGYKAMHAEHLGGLSESARVLVFMTYLNDVPNAGTHFPYQNITTEAKKGFTLIWPAYFTHPHVGVVSQTHEKYIVTGWIEFEDIRNMMIKQQGLWFK